MPKSIIDRNYTSPDVLASGVVTFKDKASGAEYVFDTTRVFPQFAEYSDLQKRMILAAVNNTVGDAAGGADDPIAAITKRGDSILAGEWTGKRAGGGGGSRVSLLAEAVAEVKGLEVADAVERLAKLDKEQKAKVAAHPAVKAYMDAARAKRAAEKAKASKAGAKEVEAELEI